MTFPLSVMYKRSSSSDGIYMRTRSATSGKRRRGQPPMIGQQDLLSQLPSEILEMIVSKLPTAEAARTSILSSRWVGVWRHRSDLVFDMRTILRRTEMNHKKKVSKSLARSFTKVMKNHRGDLESCAIYHHSYQTGDGTLKRWIQSTCEKNTKALTLESHFPSFGYIHEYDRLNMPSNLFSHPRLNSLSLCRYMIPSPQAFIGGSNLKTLKLVDIIMNVTVLSEVIAACSSLEVLLLQLVSLSPIGTLRIQNDNLRYLQVTTKSHPPRIEVYALRLEVLDIRCDCVWGDNFILVAPNLDFKRSYVAARVFPHLSCNISFLAQEEKSVWYDIILNGIHGIKRSGSLSVSVDVTNPKEVDVLEELLRMWGTVEMDELEILVKNPRGEGRGCPTLLGKTFADADFRVGKLWLYTFGDWDKEHLELALQFVSQKAVTNAIKIKIYSIPSVMLVLTELFALRKLRALAMRTNQEVIIESFT